MRATIVRICGLLLCLLVIAGGWLRYHTGYYDHMITQAAARNGIDLYLVKAVVFEESWFRPDIRGPAGEVGLMQVSKAAATDFVLRKGFPPLSRERLEEPELNIEIGCWYLRQSLDRYRNSPAPELFALLRYNAGEARADRWLQNALSQAAPSGMERERFYLSLVDFPKTREYARRILHRYRNRNFWF
jgi:soluble lytic murein transglycosylase